MTRRRIGRSALYVETLMLGGNVFGWTADRSASFAILDRFVEAGLNAIDTADVYSAWVPGHVGGQSETVIGEWLSQRGGRDRLIIATKVGAADTAAGVAYTLSTEHIVRSAEVSLRRLRTDHIDLYQAHGDDPNTPLEVSLEAFDRLIRAGNVRALGASHLGAVRLSEALDLSEARDLSRFDALQPRYNLCERAAYSSWPRGQSRGCGGGRRLPGFGRGFLSDGLGAAGRRGLLGLDGTRSAVRSSPRVARRVVTTPERENVMGGVLAGIRVLDFDRYVAGPFACACWPTSARTSFAWSGERGARIASRFRRPRTVLGRSSPSRTATSGA